MPFALRARERIPSSFMAPDSLSDLSSMDQSPSSLLLRYVSPLSLERSRSGDASRPRLLLMILNTSQESFVKRISRTDVSFPFCSFSELHGLASKNSIFMGFGNVFALCLRLLILWSSVFRGLCWFNHMGHWIGWWCWKRRDLVLVLYWILFACFSWIILGLLSILGRNMSELLLKDHFWQLWGVHWILLLRSNSLVVFHLWSFCVFVCGNAQLLFTC